MKKAFFLLFSCVFSLLQAQQGNPNDWYIRGSDHFGFILQHHNSFGNLVNGFVNGGEVNFIKPAAGDKLWHHENNFLERGVGFACFDLGNPKQLGNVYAAFVFYEIPLSKKEKPFRLYMRLAPGIAYTPVHFDALENHKNNIISSPINAYVNFKWFYKWDLCRRWRLEGGLNFSHASNGRAVVPNLGVNIVTWNTGLTYKFFSNKVLVKPLAVDSGSKAPSKHELLFWTAFGLNQVEVLGTHYVAQNYSFSYYYNKRNTHKFGGGIDLFYNPANIAQMKLSGDTLSSNLQNVQVGIKFSYCYNVGRWSLPVEMGYYAYTAFKGDGYFFHSIGMRYHFKNNIVAVMELKTNWAVANYFAFGVGYRLPLKKKN
ncbi:MAG TPA: acyloxyacyl hydrolase [Bacteroidia bacterium]|nr:acyloxyacyl hydrolase [Bacteroidia bacterium]